MELHRTSPIRLNIGAGNKRIAGWLSVDLADGADVVTDIRTLPFPDHYADEALAVHILEHIWRWEALDTLKEWRRVLKPGAQLAVEVPDLLKACRHILNGANIEQMGQFAFFGDPKHKNPLMCHRWCYTESELINLMKEAGFKGVLASLPHFHKKTRDMRVTGLA